jgi:hypothetical protein
MCNVLSVKGPKKFCSLKKQANREKVYNVKSLLKIADTLNLFHEITTMQCALKG